MCVQQLVNSYLVLLLALGPNAVSLGQHKFYAACSPRSQAHHHWQETEEANLANCCSGAHLQEFAVPCFMKLKLPHDIVRA